MNKRERAAVKQMVERHQVIRAELLGILKEGIAFVTRAGTPGAGNTLDQCRAMNRRFRLARVLLGLGQPSKKKVVKR